MEFVQINDPNDPGFKVTQPVNYLRIIFNNVNKKYSEVTCENANDYYVLTSLQNCPHDSFGSTPE